MHDWSSSVRHRASNPLTHSHALVEILAPDYIELDASDDIKGGHTAVVILQPADPSSPSFVNCSRAALEVGLHIESSSGLLMQPRTRSSNHKGAGLASPRLIAPGALPLLTKTGLEPHRATSGASTLGD